MAIRQSTGLMDFLAQHGSYKKAFEGGKLKIYTGTQPASADSPMTGTLLCTVTLASGARTEEVCSCGTVELTGGASGNVSSITVNGVEVLGATITYTTSLTVTAALIAAQINAYQSVPKYRATSSGAVITIKAMPGTGTGPNSYVVATTASTITKTDTNFGAGTGTAVAGVAGVNGLTFGTVSGGILSKSSAAWSGVNAATGTAGCFRLESTEADANGTSTTAIRLDGSVGTSGSDLNLSSTSLTSGATHTQTQFDIKVPAS